jgi:hypothetical protein
MARSDSGSGAFENESVQTCPATANPASAAANGYGLTPENRSTPHIAGSPCHEYE